MWGESCHPQARKSAHTRIWISQHPAFGLFQPPELLALPYTQRHLQGRGWILPQPFVPGKQPELRNAPAFCVLENGLLQRDLRQKSKTRLWCSFNLREPIPRSLNDPVAVASSGTKGDALPAQSSTLASCIWGLSLVLGHLELASSISITIKSYDTLVRTVKKVFETQSCNWPNSTGYNAGCPWGRDVSKVSSLSTVRSISCKDYASGIQF